MQSLIRMSMRKTLEEKFGKTIYSVTVYEKVKRVTIVLFNNSVQKDEGNDDSEALLLMVSFEKDSDHETIITKKILPFLNNKVRNDVSNAQESAA